MITKIDEKMRELKPYKLDDWQAVQLSDVEKYEGKLGVELPSDYREFGVIRARLPPSAK